MKSKEASRAKQTRSPFGRAIRQAYRLGQEDEALEPLVAVNSQGAPVGRIKRGDAVIFYDLRGEREVELTQALVDKNFQSFPTVPLDLRFVTMIEYASWLEVRVAFPPTGPVRQTLGEVLSSVGKKVLKIAESEKAIHVGYFMNGKQEVIFPGESRQVIPSPEVMNYAEVPEMSAPQVTQAILDSLESDYDLIIANYANVDVIGHIENEAAVIRAVEVVDRELGRVVEACREKRVTLLVTSDHGTVEEWLYPDGAINTGHTRNPVPFILVDFAPGLAIPQKHHLLRSKGELSDVAPTILQLLGVKVPPEMTGRSLITDSSFLAPPRPKILLLILDGWGMREDLWGNLIARAQTPQFDSLWQEFPHSLLQAAGEAVGMPPGTVGNSESGHLHLGAGRRVLLDRVRIDEAIKQGQFFQNEAFLWAMEEAKRNGQALHLLGIVSFYSSHGTLDHLFALLELARRQAVPQVFVHCLIGRRGEKPESGAIYVEKVEKKCRELGLGQVVTVIGRFWALDREENWDRVEKTYRALIWGEGTPVRVE